MAKEIEATVKLNISAGKATPAPPVGPALGQYGIPLMDFCKIYNERTKDMGDVVIPAVITIYKDKSFDFIVKTPPASELLKKAADVERGSGEPNREKVGKATLEQVKEIAERKMQDLNTQDLDKATKIIMGTAKQMGIEIIE
mgnify:CR=1 FL=1